MLNLKNIIIDFKDGSHGGGKFGPLNMQTKTLKLSHKEVRNYFVEDPA